jgi:hypothetical protein
MVFLAMLLLRPTLSVSLSLEMLMMLLALFDITVIVLSLLAIIFSIFMVVYRHLHLEQQPERLRVTRIYDFILLILDFAALIVVLQLSREMESVQLTFKKLLLF